jgi:hypothetical protein
MILKSFLFRINLKKRKLRGKGSSFDNQSRGVNLIDKIKLQLEKEKMAEEQLSTRISETTEKTLDNVDDVKPMSSSLKPDSLLWKKKTPSVKKPTIKFET